MNNSLFDMSGQVALVTGGSSGIGFAIARGFLQQGARVYIVARKAEKLEAACQELSQYGDCHKLQADLSTGEASKALAQSFVEYENKLDVLVNCAGNVWAAPLEEFPDVGWDKVLSVNVRGVFNLTRDLLPQLKAAGSKKSSARVINIGSVAGIVSKIENTYSYAASKAAVHQLTRNLAKELAPFQINVNAIAPGRFPSSMTTYLTNNEALLEKDCELIPLGRHGRLEEAAALAITLATTAGAYMTGSIIPLDGGITLTG
jgi:NAD(P)-dependent dehydrogenase (short-subunit alcohol dehydrogenase family)